MQSTRFTTNIPFWVLASLFAFSSEAFGQNQTQTDPWTNATGSVSPSTLADFDIEGDGYSEANTGLPTGNLLASPLRLAKETIYGPDPLDGHACIERDDGVFSCERFRPGVEIMHGMRARSPSALVPWQVQLSQIYFRINATEAFFPRTLADLDTQGDTGSEASTGLPAGKLLQRPRQLRKETIFSAVLLDGFACLQGDNSDFRCERFESGYDVGYGIMARLPDAKVPWQAQLFFDSTRFSREARARQQLWELQHACGGTLIDYNWILTAAHCVDQRLANDELKVRLGTSTISQNRGVKYKIELAVRHPNYNPDTYENDIALLRIGRTQQEESAQQQAQDGVRDAVGSIRRYGLSQADTPLTSGQIFQATGWGDTVRGADVRFSPTLLEVQVGRMPQSLCETLPGYMGRIKPSMLCGTSPNSDTCQGDSGGPLVTRGPSFRSTPVLVGVVSWGRGCAVFAKPGIYTRVSFYNSWIDSVMANPPTPAEQLKTDQLINARNRRSEGRSAELPVNRR